MANMLVDGALKELEALGLPITASTPYLIELLMQEGVDVLTTFPRIVQTIEQLGGNTWQVLEEVASGMYQYGPVGYVQHTVENYFEPQVNKVREIQRHKAALTEQHRATMQHIQNQIAALHATNGPTAAGSTAFTGQAASAMLTSFTEISTHLEKLMQVMDDSQQIDRDLQNDLHAAVETIAALAIIDLIIFAVVFVVVFVGSQLVLIAPEVVLAPESGGLSLAAGAGASLGGAAAIAGGSVVALLPAEGAAILGILLYAFGRWAVRHAMLEMAHPAASYSHPLINSGPTLPNPPPTAAEVKLADDLFKEFGGAISKTVLQYLVKILGASKLTAAMIRCLYENNYLNLPKSVYGWEKLEGDNNRAWENIADHLGPNDLEGAWKDANPDQVDPTTIKNTRYVSGADHATEVQNALNSIINLLSVLDNRLKVLDNRISHAPDPSAQNIRNMIDQKTHLQKLKDAFTRLRDFMRSKTANKSPSPNTWPEQGKLPILEDLLQSSTCKVPDAKYYK